MSGRRCSASAVILSQSATRRLLAGGVVGTMRRPSSGGRPRTFRNAPSRASWSASAATSDALNWLYVTRAWATSDTAAKPAFFRSWAAVSAYSDSST